LKIDNVDEAHPHEARNTLPELRMGLTEVEDGRMLMRNIVRSSSGKLFYGKCKLQIVPDGKGVKMCTLILEDQNYEIEYNGEIEENIEEKVNSALH
jgi:hypothetical protein